MVISVSPAYTSNVPPTKQNRGQLSQLPGSNQSATKQQSHLAAWAGSLPLRICRTGMQQSFNPINRFRYDPLRASVMRHGLKIPTADQPRLARVLHSCIRSCIHACMHVSVQAPQFVPELGFRHWQTTDTTESIESWQTTVHMCRQHPG